MKTLKLFLSAILMVSLLTSCEKEEEVINLFIGTWENTEVTNLGSVVATMTYMSDMTMTFTFIIDINGAITTTTNDYTYSYTDTKIIVSQAGTPDEVSDYIINGDELTLSDNGADEVTYTKTN